jgi:hypothetical protein
MILLVPQIVKHQIIAEYELEGMWKEAIMPNIKYCTSIYLEGQRKSTIKEGVLNKHTVRIAGFWAEI